MMKINYVVCFVLMIGIMCEIYLILKRNRKIILKGKDDFMLFSLLVILILFIFPIASPVTLIENVRNILLLILVFGTTAIKRGVSESGIEKVCFTIRWEEIRKIYVNMYQISKIEVICETRKGKYKLLFSKYQLKELLKVTEKKVSEIYLQSVLQEEANK